MTVAPLPQLHPLGLGQLLDQAIRLYRRNFLNFIGIIAIVQIPLGLLQMGSALLTLSSVSPPGGIFGASPPPDSLGPAFFAGIAGSILVPILSFVLIQVVATAAMTRAVADSYLGEPVGIIDAYRKIGRSWVSLLGALLLAVVVAIVLLIWTLVPCVGWLTGVGMLVFFGMVITPLIAPTIVLEKQTASQSIRRAWDLARRRFWWVLGFVFVLYIFAQIIIAGPTLLISFGFQLITGGNPFNPSVSQTITQTTLQSLVSIVGALIYLPLQLTAITLMYFDLRIRTEGFDLTLLTADVSDEQTDMSEITTQAPQPEKGNLVTMTEMGYFVLLEIGALILYFVVVAVLGALVFTMMAATGGPGF